MTIKPLATTVSGETSPSSSKELVWLQKGAWLSCPPLFTRNNPGHLTVMWERLEEKGQIEEILGGVVQ